MFICVYVHMYVLQAVHMYVFIYINIFLCDCFIAIPDRVKKAINLRQGLLKVLN